MSRLSKFTSYAKSIVTRPEGGAVSRLEGAQMKRLDGTPLEAAVWQGKVVLFVNVASRCGLTPQYAGLQELQSRFKARGFTVVGTPCNQFMGQEPGTAEEIGTFCSATYGVDFPLLEKSDVNGTHRSALYRFLIDSPAGGGARIGWNFEKFLVGRDGAVVARFGPKVEPAAPEVVAAIEASLG